MTENVVENERDNCGPGENGRDAAHLVVIDASYSIQTVVGTNYSRLCESAKQFSLVTRKTALYR